MGRSELRRRRGSVLALAMVAFLGLGAALGAFLAAYRTDHAYPEHVKRARMADIVINPSLTSVDSDRVIRSLPHVRRVHTYELTYAGYLDPSRKYTLGELLADNRGNLYTSPDGHYLDSDRIIVEQGALPTGPREVFVTDEYRGWLGRQVGHPLRVGDRIPIGFVWSAIDLDVDDPGTVTVDPIGVERLRISGFGRLASEVLDDPLFPQEELIVSPDVARRFSCPPAPIPDSQDQEVLLPAIFPRDCALLYRYYALTLDDPAAVGDVARLAQRRLSALNEPLWKRVGDTNSEQLAYYPIITTRRDADARVAHSIRPTVVALRIFGGVALGATIVVLALGAARAARDSRDTDGILRALGARSATRWALRIMPATVGASLGAVAGISLGILLSPIGPVGEVSRVAAQRTISAPAAVVVPFAVGVAVVLALVLGGVGLFVGRRDQRPARLRWFRRVRTPEIADGVGAAFAPGQGLLLPSAAAVAVAAVVASLVFGANLGRVTGTPATYGWPWQIGVLTGSGYGDTDPGAVRTTLAPEADVGGWDSLGVSSGEIDGRPLPILSSDRAVRLPVVSGRLPREPGEMALGRTTATRLGVGIGATVRVTSGVGAPARSARIVGLVVLPSIGQFLSDRAGLGAGAFAIVTPAELRQNTTFTGVRLREGASTAQALASIRPQIGSWDSLGEPPVVLADAARPPEIINADAMRAAPALLAALLVITLLAAHVLALIASVKARARDYAVLRALGFRRAQVKRSVRWQAVATMAAGVVIGVPVGLVGGRQLWSTFAEQLGLAPDVSVPAVLVGLVALGALIGAVVVAVIPAHRAIRRSPVESLTKQ